MSTIARACTQAQSTRTTPRPTTDPTPLIDPTRVFHPKRRRRAPAKSVHHLQRSCQSDARKHCALRTSGPRWIPPQYTHEGRCRRSERCTILWSRLSAGHAWLLAEASYCARPPHRQAWWRTQRDWSCRQTRQDDALHASKDAPNKHVYNAMGHHVRIAASCGRNAALRAWSTSMVCMACFCGRALTPHGTPYQSCTSIPRNPACFRALILLATPSVQRCNVLSMTDFP